MPARRASRRSNFPEYQLLFERRTYMAKIGKALLKVLKLLLVVILVLFVVYFWNLDQKVLGWAYKQVNTMFDRKKVDLVF
jgi:hypothetical protein